MSASVPIKNMFPLVLPFASGAGDAAATLELRNAAIEFCQKTHVWAPLLDKLSLEEGDREVELDLPVDAELNEVRQVWYKDATLTPTNPDALARVGITPTSTGTPLYYEFSEWVLQIWPLPIVSEEDVITVRASLYPAVDADAIPERLFTRYRQHIADGALDRLLKYDEPWARAALKNMKILGLDYGVRFQMGIDAITSKVQKANVRTKRRVTGQYF